MSQLKDQFVKFFSDKGISIDRANNYAEKFISQEVDLLMVAKLTEENLREMGVVVGDRIRLGTSAADESVRSRLSRLDVKFCTRDINFLLNKNQAGYTILTRPDLTKEEAVAVITSASSAVKSVTRMVIGRHYDIFLDGPLHSGQGQTKSSLYYAFSQYGAILAAKVYHGFKEDFDREVAMLKAVGKHENIASLLDSFSINDNRHVFLMPFYARSAMDLMLQYSSLPLGTIAVIARDCFKALAFLHSKSICYVDLKPSNIMLQVGKPPDKGDIKPGQLMTSAVLIDLAAAVYFNEPLRERTEAFCLDVEAFTGSEEIDWCCFGTTLCSLDGLGIERYNLRWELKKDLDNGLLDEKPGLRDVVKACIQKPCSSSVEGAVNILCDSSLSRLADP